MNGDRISAARVIVSSPGRNFVTLVIETEKGFTGIGDATLNGREQAVASYLRDYLVPMLVGRDPSAIEDTWQLFYKGAYWRRGPVTMTAIAAVDVALWDIKAKRAQMPLYELLGGASRKHMLCYTHADGVDIEGALASIRKKQDAGFHAIRVQAGVPGLQNIYGVHKGHAVQDEDHQTRPNEGDWNTTAYLNHVPELFAAVRDTFGKVLEVLHDAHHRLSPNEAAQLGHALEPFRLFWLEDAVPAENQELWRRIRGMTRTPLAVGEIFNSLHDCDRLISEQLIDYLRMTIVHGGGITALRRVADFAAHYGVRTGFHGANDLSPITMGAALHFGRWVPNFGIQEYAAPPALASSVFKWDWQVHDGYMLSGEKPGHGVEFDEVEAAKYPYRRRYLDVNRLTDGTLWSW